MDVLLCRPWKHFGPFGLGVLNQEVALGHLVSFGPLITARLSLLTPAGRAGPGGPCRASPSPKYDTVRGEATKGAVDVLVWVDKL